MEEEKYVRRCIQLAQNGLCDTTPNLMVGAVIVCNGRIIDEDYHIRCGEAHTGVNTIHSVKESSLLKRSTIYVSLEPCAHYGKTPPCADLIIEGQIPRIVIGCRDPFAKVARRDIQKLKDTGREVIVGVLEEDCKNLIWRFVIFHSLHRPYITLKWAEPADKRIDKCRRDGKPVILFTPLISMLVHKRRAEHSAIMVGTHTAELGNPSLTVRNWQGQPPVRIVIDRQQRLSPSLHLFDDSIRTFVFMGQPHAAFPNTEYAVIDFQQDILPQVTRHLYAQGLQSLLVEGGSYLLQPFINIELWNEIFVEESPLKLFSGVKAPEIGNKIPYVDEQYFGGNFRHYIVTRLGQQPHSRAS